MENKTKYIVKEEDIIQVGNSLILTNKEIVVAIEYANEALISLYKNTKNFDINIFEVLGMRNLSGLVGEYFAKSLVKCSKGKLQSNLHQDGILI